MRAWTDQQILSIERPEPVLWTYYLIRSVLFGPGFPVALVFYFFRFRTLRYRFDEEGVLMTWGALFRREINLTYSRIQDIHLRSNLLERWLGLARIEIQTASGSRKAEMTIEGIIESERLRDFLYARMRGVAGGPSLSSATPLDPSSENLSPNEETSAVLRELTLELRALREALVRAGRGSE